MRIRVKVMNCTRGIGGRRVNVTLNDKLLKYLGPKIIVD